MLDVSATASGSGLPVGGGNGAALGLQANGGVKRPPKPSVEDEDDDEEEGEDIELDQLLQDRDKRAFSRHSLGDEEDGVGYSHSPRTPGSAKRPLHPDEDEDDVDDPMALVSKAVPETDDPTLPALTVRVILIGSVLCVIGAAVSQVCVRLSEFSSDLG